MINDPVFTPIPRFIPNSAFYPQFRVLSSIPRFIPNSAFYPQFRVFYSGSAFRFRIPVPRFIPTPPLFLDEDIFEVIDIIAPTPRKSLQRGQEKPPPQLSSPSPSPSSKRVPDIPSQRQETSPEAEEEGKVRI
jgi:hypothetical protein